MGYEVDFLAVGDASKSGDAIALRFGNLYGTREEQVVIVIDAGTKQAGQEICDHILEYYGTSTVDLVVSTHPDADHASGLCEVVNNLQVNQILLHLPWVYAPEIKNLFKNKQLTTIGLEQKIEKSLQHAKNLEDLAISKGIPIFEPFAGLTGFNKQMMVLGPTPEYYKSLLTNFRGTPDPLDFLKQLSSHIKQKGEELIEWAEETLHLQSETLDHTDKKTSAENSSSAILLFNIEGRQLLFTADAGVDSLSQAINYATQSGISLQEIKLFQVPHHGSKHNINSEILNFLPSSTAMISACKDGDPKHPSRKVVNALLRRSFLTHSTKGVTVRHHYNAPDRVSWSRAQPLTFFEKVEND